MNNLLIIAPQMAICDAFHEILKQIFHESLSDNSLTIKTKYYHAEIQVLKQEHHEEIQNYCDCIFYIDPVKLPDEEKAQIECIIDTKGGKYAYDRYIEKIYFDFSQKVEISRSTLLSNKDNQFSRILELLECQTWNEMKILNTPNKKSKEIQNDQNINDFFNTEDVDMDQEIEEFAHLIQEMKLIKTSDPDSKERKVRAELLMNKLINFMDSDDM